MVGSMVVGKPRELCGRCMYICITNSSKIHKCNIIQSKESGTMKVSGTFIHKNENGWRTARSAHGVLFKIDEELHKEAFEEGTTLCVNFSILSPILLLGYDSLAIHFRKVDAVYPFGYEIEEDDIPGFSTRVNQIIQGIRTAIIQSKDEINKLNLQSAAYIMNNVNDPTSAYPLTKWHECIVTLATGWSRGKHSQEYSKVLEGLGRETLPLSDTSDYLKEQVEKLLVKCREFEGFRNAQREFEFDEGDLIYMLNLLKVRRA